jgi:predicted transcriptional regulator
MTPSQTVAEALYITGATQLATQLKCSRQAVYLWANGERKVPAEVYIVCQKIITEKGEKK